jgi:hypothetical protein
MVVDDEDLDRFARHARLVRQVSPEHRLARKQYVRTRRVPRTYRVVRTTKNDAVGRLSVVPVRPYRTWRLEVATMIAQLSSVVGSGVPSLIAPVGAVTTVMAIGLGFLVASVLVIAVGSWWRTS